MTFIIDTRFTSRLRLASRPSRINLENYVEGTSGVPKVVVRFDILYLVVYKKTLDPVDPLLNCYL